MELVESGEHKFKKEEVLRIALIKETSDELMTLFKSVRRGVAKRGKILKTFVPLTWSKHILGLLPSLMDYEKRGEIVDYEEREEEDEEREEEDEEMVAGDLIISKSPIRIDVEKYHEVFEIDSEHGDMFFVIKRICTKKHLLYGTTKDGLKEYVKYDVKPRGNLRWECKDTSCKIFDIETSCENYEIFYDEKAYEI